MRFITLFLVLLSVSGFAQTITSAQQKALNSYVDYANQSGSEVSLVVSSLMTYYPKIHRKEKGYYGPPRYVCPVQLEEYYLKEVGTASKGLSSTYTTTLNARLKELQSVAEKIDGKCKELDTYHKLEDYKTDNYAKANTIIAEVQALLPDYRQKQKALQLELESVAKKLTAGAPEGPYRKTDRLLRAEVERERAFLDLWNLNMNEEVHTGWPVDKLEQSILQTDAQLKSLKSSPPTLKYPASTMWSSFLENLGEVLSIKRNGLDKYNYEAKKSDAYSNQVYLDLINYFNGTLVSDHNTFLQFAMQDGYYGLKSIKYVPLFEVRSTVKSESIDVKPFKDIPRTPVTIAVQKVAISKPVYAALASYVEFINETYYQVSKMQTSMQHFNGTAADYRTMASYEKRNPMHYEFKNFELPLSYYQKTVVDSKSLPPAVAKPLNDQAEVLINILKEMNDQSSSLQAEVESGQYEKDHVEHVYKIIERQKVLIDTWDERKELFYADIRKVYDAYPPANPASSWYKSGKALRDLADLDHDALMKAKLFYKGDATISISTEKIDQSLRDVIAKEYDNMKGIEKLGRYNGLCPYTPYEDLPKTSRNFSEQIAKNQPVGDYSRYDDPYYKLQYFYNDIADDYNRFCELSKTVLLLKTVYQLELWDKVYYPEKEMEKPKTATPESKMIVVTQTAQETPTVIKTPEVTATATQDPPVEPAPNINTHSTSVQHDTIYIEKRDTIYLAEPGGNVRSMEGYATNNMILLLDVSGSMNTPEKLPVLKQSVLDLLTMMRQEDEVGIVVFSEKPKVILDPVSFKEEKKIQSAIDKLKSAGKTDGNAALKLAYKVADENYIRGGNNRIILATDGEFAVSEETIQLIESFAKEDIFLSVFNFGKGSGSSKNLEKLTVLGKGNYSAISKGNVDMKLIQEAKAKRKK
ncbi:MAG TPA: VWA domain-containing protein [Ohtaekwangia sp.]